MTCRSFFLLQKQYIEQSCIDHKVMHAQMIKQNHCGKKGYGNNSNGDDCGKKCMFFTDPYKISKDWGDQGKYSPADDELPTIDAIS